MKRIEIDNLETELQKLIDSDPDGLEGILEKADIEPVEVLRLLVELEWLLEDDLPSDDVPEPIDYQI